MKTVADHIEHLSPCSEALKWARGYTSAEKAWAECPRGDWLLWLVGKNSGPPESDGRKKLVLCACECASLVLPHTKNARALTCIETAEKWARGEATIAELRTARTAVAATTAATAAYAAAYAAATAAYAAAYAAATAAAATAAYAAAAAAARVETLRICADIVRRHYPTPPVIHKGIDTWAL